MAARQLVAFDLDHAHVSAVEAVVSRDRVVVKSWMTAKRPDTLDRYDAKGMGAWIGSELAKAGLGKSKVIVSVPRGDVVLKRMGLPTGTDGTELAGMVRLQMIRQLTMPIEGTAIDFVPISATGSEPPGSAEGVWVLAGAMPADRLQWVRDAAKAGKVRMHRIGLRSAGAATLLAADSQRQAGPLMGIALGQASAEFVIVENGQLVFARAADIDRPESQEQEKEYAQRVAVEAKRTWISYRVSRESAEVESIRVLDSGPLAEAVAGLCSEALEMPASAVGLPDVGGAIRVPADFPEGLRHRMAPLIGLLAESAMGGQVLDFANPRKAPDLGAIRRQRVLLAVLLVIIVGGAGYLFRVGRLNEIDRQIEAAEDQKKELDQRYLQYLVDEATLNHLRAWSQIGVDWLAHLRRINEQLPDPEHGVLREIGGELRSAGVVFEPKNRRIQGGKWVPRQVLSIRFSGVVREREYANELRSKLVDSKVYTINTQGPDLEDRFTFELLATAASPYTSEPAPELTQLQAEEPAEAASPDADVETPPGTSAKGGGS